MAAQRKTRLARVKEQEAKKSLVRYTFYTIAIVAFVALVGVPLVIPRITQFIDETTGRGNGINSGDTTPPPPPNLRDVPRYSNENTIDISGNTEPGAKVYLVVNGKDQELLADAQGSFTSSVSLMDGQNEIYAFSEDQAGNKSNNSVSYSITIDKEPPELTINFPKDGSIFFKQENSVQIEGQTESGASVDINERVAIVNRDGKFSMRVSLSEGANNFDIIAVDEAGNETKVTLTLSYTP